MADAARLEILLKTAADHAAAPWRGKGKVVSEAAAKLGCSLSTLHRWLKEEAGYDPGKGRKTRSDKGKTALAPDDLEKIAGMVYVARRGTGKQMLSIKGAVTLARANGMDAPLSPSSVSRQLQKRGMHPRQLSQPTPHAHQKSNHPNHVWMLDASLSVLFYLSDDGLKGMNEEEFNQNKPQNFERIGKQRLNRWIVVDHFSGAFYLEYRLGGESMENVTEVFMNAISSRPDEPLHGVPLILGMDKGSGNKAKASANLFKNLQVEIITHEVGNSRAKGAVEVLQNIVETGFESRFRMKEVRNLGHINYLARQWSRHFNATAIHTRHGQSRYGLWMSITAEQLRIAPPPALLREMVVSEPVDRTVRGDLTVSFKVKGWPRHDYDVRYVPGVMIGEKVMVRVNPYRAPMIDVLSPGSDPDQWLTVEHLERDAAGFFEGAAEIGAEFKSLPETIADKARKILTAMAYGTADAEEADRRRKKNAPAFEGVIDAFADVDTAVLPDWMPRQGTPLGIPAPQREAARIPLTRAALRLKEMLGRNLKPEEYAALHQRYADSSGVPEEDIPLLCRDLCSKPLLRVVGG